MIQVMIQVTTVSKFHALIQDVMVWFQSQTASILCEIPIHEKYDDKRYQKAMMIQFTMTLIITATNCIVGLKLNISINRITFCVDVLVTTDISLTKITKYIGIALMRGSCQLFDYKQNSVRSS